MNAIYDWYMNADFVSALISAIVLTGAVALALICWQSGCELIELCCGLFADEEEVNNTKD